MSGVHVYNSLWDATCLSIVSRMNRFIQVKLVSYLELSCYEGQGLHDVCPELPAKAPIVDLREDEYNETNQECDVLSISRSMCPPV